jgi:hypothetical protein
MAEPPTLFPLLPAPAPAPRPAPADPKRGARLRQAERGQISARDEVAGAPAIDPAILLALWVYATSEGEGSAREISSALSRNDPPVLTRSGPPVA